jgi:hypothetical protein
MLKINLWWFAGFRKNVLFLRISSRDNKKTKTGWSNHRNGGFHRDKCKVYQQREDTRVNADTLRQSVSKIGSMLISMPKSKNSKSIVGLLNSFLNKSKAAI